MSTLKAFGENPEWKRNNDNNVQQTAEVVMKKPSFNDWPESKFKPTYDVLSLSLLSAYIFSLQCNR